MLDAVIYPGTFDPLTLGHLDLIERAQKIFSRVVVGVAAGVHKTPFFDFQRRIELTRESLCSLPRVEVQGFDGLLVEFAQELGISVILRGLRAVSDFEYEFQLASMNRRLNNQIETFFLTPSESYSFISARLIREIARLGGDITPFVPKNIALALQRQLYGGAQHGSDDY